MKVIFLDRDGVINKDPGGTDYVKSWQEFHFLPKVKSALKRLSNNGFKIFIISNQAGVAKGLYTKKSLSIITKNMLTELSESNINVEGIHYCIHRQEDNCSCRKPKTGLIERALEKLKHQNIKLNLNKTFFIGDTIRDVETGKSAGLKTILVFSGKEKPKNKNNWRIIPDFTASDLSEAVDLVLRN